MLILALLLLGGGLAWEFERSRPSALPGGVSQVALSRAVSNALKTEKSGGRLRNFANAVRPYSMTFAAQLDARAQALASQAQQAASAPLLHAVPTVVQALGSSRSFSTLKAESQ